MPRKWTIKGRRDVPYLEAEGPALLAETDVTAVDLRDVEPLTRALAEILGSCQEVAHEVEDPTQACAEIEATARKALKAFEEDSDAA